jgi:hypothetical protein
LLYWYKSTNTDAAGAGFMFIQPDNATFAALAALIDEVSSEESE